MKIFLVEDDQKLAHMVQQHLEKYAYQVTAAVDFQRIIAEFQREAPELVLLDVNLPYFDGFYWAQQIRKISKVPILFLSARDSQMDQIMALEYGADDYLTKPFSFELLLAKIKSQTRRVYGELSSLQERIVQVGGLHYLPERLEVTFQGQQETLTKREGELLEALMTAFPRIVNRERLLEILWDTDQFVDDNTLSVNVGRLRKKLEALGLVTAITTIRGKGYQLKVKE